MPEDLMNGYFKKPAPTPEFDYAKTPDPCAQ
jgi:ribose transport system substrate-binding protein